MKIQKLIPFDVERAKSGDPIITRIGQKATFIAHVPAGVAGVEDGREFVIFAADQIVYWRPVDGISTKKDGYYCTEQDLFMANAKDDRPLAGEKPL